jgi:hypothetical protein
MTDAFPMVRYGRTERLPHDGKRRCGSSLAHRNCKFAGPIDTFLNCDANPRAWSDCPYHASGFVTIYEDRP